MRPIALAFPLTVALALAGCASTPEPAPAAAAAPSAASAAAPLASARANALVRDTVIIAAQPTAEDLAAWRDEGVRSIFNVRSASEMANRSLVPFDEVSLAGELGMAYVQRGIAGNADYTPEALEAFAAHMRDADGPVLLHCASGTRAGLLYAAYAVKYLGKSPDEAMRDLAPLGHWPLPLERMTGTPLKLEVR